MQAGVKRADIVQNAQNTPAMSCGSGKINIAFGGLAALRGEKQHRMEFGQNAMLMEQSAWILKGISSSIKEADYSCGESPPLRVPKE